MYGQRTKRAQEHQEEAQEKVVPRSSSFASKILLVVFILVDILFLLYLYLLAKNAPVDSILGQLVGKKPCDQPLAYSLGSFDTKFGISKTDFLAAINTAAQVWDAAAGKKVFVYDAANGPLKMNLTFDYRQQETLRLQKLGITINDDRATYDALNVKYTALLTLLKTKQAAFNTAVAAHNAKVADLEKQIAYWNAKGGAPQPVYNSLVQEQNQVQAESAQLLQMEAGVNATIDDLNAVVPALNKVAKLLNLEAVNYNSASAPLSQGFEEGVYESSSTGTSITIFQYENRATLVRVLEHELGHALGLAHDTDPKAIMFPVNHGTDPKLAPQDVAELKQACGL